MPTRLDVAVLIAALGAGAVLAVPRHAQLATEARRAEVAAVARATTTAAQLAHARWLAEGEPPLLTGPRGPVAITYGYPSAATLPLLLADAEVAAFRYDGGFWRHAGAGADGACGVAYQPPAAAGQNPAVTGYTSGC